MWRKYHTVKVETLSIDEQEKVLSDIKNEVEFYTTACLQNYKDHVHKILPKFLFSKYYLIFQKVKFILSILFFLFFLYCKSSTVLENGSDFIFSCLLLTCCIWTGKTLKARKFIIINKFFNSRRTVLKRFQDSFCFYLDFHEHQAKFYLTSHATTNKPSEEELKKVERNSDDFVLMDLNLMAASALYHKKYYSIEACSDLKKQETYLKLYKFIKNLKKHI